MDKKQLASLIGRIRTEEKENFEKFFNRLKGKVSPTDFKLIIDAYNIAKAGHREQFRDDGTRYFEHCRETALIMMDELGIYDTHLIVAALLHDMMEDTRLITLEGIAFKFGEEVAYLVETMSKPKKDDARFANDRERHQFYFKTLFEATVRCIIAKLCDRLHNMRNINSCAPEKIARKIKETEDVYIPLCVIAMASNDPQIKAWAEFLADKLCEALEAAEIEQER